MARYTALLPFILSTINVVLAEPEEFGVGNGISLSSDHRSLMSVTAIVGTVVAVAIAAFLIYLLAFWLATCPVNSYANGSGKCIDCATGYTNAAGDNTLGTATTCGECAENYYVSSATTCTACADGKHIAAGALSATITTCTNNTCTCTNGIAATAGTSACDTHKAEICASCYANYALSGNLCKPSCTAPSAVAGWGGTACSHCHIRDLPPTFIGVDTNFLSCSAGYTGTVTFTCAEGSTTYTAAIT